VKLRVMDRFYNIQIGIERNRAFFIAKTIRQAIKKRAEPLSITIDWTLKLFDINSNRDGREIDRINIETLNYKCAINGLINYEFNAISENISLQIYLA